MSVSSFVMTSVAESALGNFFTRPFTLSLSPTPGLKSTRANAPTDAGIAVSGSLMPEPVQARTPAYAPTPTSSVATIAADATIARLRPRRDFGGSSPNWTYEGCGAVASYAVDP